MYLFIILINCRRNFDLENAIEFIKELNNLYKKYDLVLHASGRKCLLEDAGGNEVLGGIYFSSKKGEYCCNLNTRWCNYYSKFVDTLTNGNIKHCIESDRKCNVCKYIFNPGQLVK